MPTGPCLYVNRLAGNASYPCQLYLLHLSRDKDSIWLNKNICESFSHSGTGCCILIGDRPMSLRKIIRPSLSSRYVLTTTTYDIGRE